MTMIRMFRQANTPHFATTYAILSRNNVVSRRFAASTAGSPLLSRTEQHRPHGRSFATPRSCRNPAVSRRHIPTPTEPESGLR
jgi:hypothetical protein